MPSPTSAFRSWREDEGVLEAPGAGGDSRRAHSGGRTSHPAIKECFFPVRRPLSCPLRLSRGREVETADGHSGLDGVLIDHWEGRNGRRSDGGEEEGRVNGGGGGGGIWGNSWDL